MAGTERRPVVTTDDAAVLEKVAQATAATPLHAKLDNVADPKHREKLQLVSCVFAYCGGGKPDRVLALSAELLEAGTAVVLLAEQPEQVAFAAMQAGVFDVVAAGGSAADYMAGFERATARLAPVTQTYTPDPTQTTQQVSVPASERKVVAVVSPKGGVGKTMLATNLAVGLAQHAPNSVVLVDADVIFGDVATALNLNPQYTMPDMLDAIAAQDALALKPMLTRHESGMYVVGSSDDPTITSAVSPSSTTQLVQMLSESFRYVIIDTAPGLADHTLAALAVCTELVLVSAMEVSGVRGLRKALQVLQTLELVPSRKHLVINDAEANRGLTLEDVEANIHQKVDVQVPSSRRIPLSMNQGIPLLLDQGRDDAGKAIRSLVDRIAGVATQAPAESKSLFNWRK